MSETKNMQRATRRHASSGVRIKRAHKKIHLGRKIREENEGARAAGILAKTGIRISQPASAEVRDKKAQVVVLLQSAVRTKQNIAAEHAYIHAQATLDLESKRNHAQ